MKYIMHTDYIVVYMTGVSPVLRELAFYSHVKQALACRHHLNKKKSQITSTTLQSQIT